MPVSSNSIDISTGDGIGATFTLRCILQQVALFTKRGALDIDIRATQISIAFETTEMVQMPNTIKSLEKENNTYYFIKFFVFFVLLKLS